MKKREARPQPATFAGTSGISNPEIPVHHAQYRPSGSTSRSAQYAPGTEPSWAVPGILPTISLRGGRQQRRGRRSAVNNDEQEARRTRLLVDDLATDAAATTDFSSMTLTEGGSASFDAADIVATAAAGKKGGSAGPSLATSGKRSVGRVEPRDGAPEEVRKDQRDGKVRRGERGRGRGRAGSGRGRGEAKSSSPKREHQRAHSSAQARRNRAPVKSLSPSPISSQATSSRTSARAQRVGVEKRGKKSPGHPPTSPFPEERVMEEDDDHRDFSEEIREVERKYQGDEATMEAGEIEESDFAQNESIPSDSAGFGGSGFWGGGGGGGGSSARRGAEEEKLPHTPAGIWRVLSMFKGRFSSDVSTSPAPSTPLSASKGGIDPIADDELVESPEKTSSTKRRKSISRLKRKKQVEAGGDWIQSGSESEVGSEGEVNVNEKKKIEVEQDKGSWGKSKGGSWGRHKGGSWGRMKGKEREKAITEKAERDKLPQSAERKKRLRGHVKEDGGAGWGKGAARSSSNATAEVVHAQLTSLPGSPPISASTSSSFSSFGAAPPPAQPAPAGAPVPPPTAALIASAPSVATEEVVQRNQSKISSSSVDNVHLQQKQQQLQPHQQQSLPLRAPRSPITAAPISLTPHPPATTPTSPASPAFNKSVSLTSPKGKPKKNKKPSPSPLQGRASAASGEAGTSPPPKSALHDIRSSFKRLRKSSLTPGIKEGIEEKIKQEKLDASNEDHSSDDVNSDSWVEYSLADEELAENSDIDVLMERKGSRGEAKKAGEAAMKSERGKVKESEAQAEKGKEKEKEKEKERVKLKFNSEKVAKVPEEKRKKQVEKIKEKKDRKDKNEKQKPTPQRKTKGKKKKKSRSAKVGQATDAQEKEGKKEEYVEKVSILEGDWDDEDDENDEDFILVDEFDETILEEGEDEEGDDDEGDDDDHESGLESTLMERVWPFLFELRISSFWILFY